MKRCVTIYYALLYNCVKTCPSSAKNEYNYEYNYCHIRVRAHKRTQEKVLCKKSFKIVFHSIILSVSCRKVVPKDILSKYWWIVICYLNWFARICGE